MVSLRSAVFLLALSIFLPLRTAPAFAEPVESREPAAAGKRKKTTKKKPAKKKPAKKSKAKRPARSARKTPRGSARDAMPRSHYPTQPAGPGDIPHEQKDDLPPPKVPAED